MDGFDWPAACLEMEQLIGGWEQPGGAAPEADWNRAVRGEGPGGGGEGAHQKGDRGLGNNAEGRPGHGAGGAMADREEEMGAREMDEAAGEMEADRLERAVVDLGEVHGHGGGDITAGRGVRSGGPPSAPPGLEHFCLPSVHIAEVNCLFLVGP